MFKDQTEEIQTNTIYIDPNTGEEVPSENVYFRKEETPYLLINNEMTRTQLLKVTEKPFEYTNTKD